MIEVEKLSFSYHKQEVLHEVSFNALSGELICLLGENGAGKTTLFKCLMGFLRSYEGEIRLDRELSKDLSIRKLAQKIAYIPQAHEPSYNYPVLDIVLMGSNILLKNYQNPGKNEVALVLETLAFLGISHLAERGYAQISGGERQLVLIARALVQKSKLLIMDEPTANLDYGNQLKVMRQAKALTQQGYTVLLSTHNPEHALHFSDKILILSNGSALRYGKAEEILTPEIMHTIYGVDVEILRTQTSWGQVPLIAPRLQRD